jgi:hypothetical protein
VNHREVLLILTTGGTSAILPMEVILNHNYPEVKLGVFCCIMTFQNCTRPLNKFIYFFKVVKLLLKHPVLIVTCWSNLKAGQVPQPYIMNGPRFPDIPAHLPQFTAL